MKKAISATFREAEGLYELFFEYLDTKRNSSPEYFERQKTKLAEMNRLLGERVKKGRSPEGDRLLRFRKSQPF